jgi:hypothetical protein
MERVKMGKRDSRTQSDMDWEKRTLCRDESCIGTIGSNGRCRICGKSYGSEAIEDVSVHEAKKNAPSFEDESPDEVAAHVEPVKEDEGDENEAISSNGRDWENRILCSDENCIGVIGPDGKCKECGKTL